LPGPKSGPAKVRRAAAAPGRRLLALRAL